jgi:hypothetical protein
VFRKSLCTYKRCWIRFSWTIVSKNWIKQLHTSTATSIVTTKSTYSSLSAQRLSECTVFIQMWIEVVVSAQLQIVNWMTTVHYQAEVQVFFLSTVTTFWVHPLPILWVPCTLSLDAKWQVHKVDHCPLSSAEVRNAWNCTSTVQYIFVVWCLNTGTTTVMLLGMFLAVCWVTGIWFAGEDFHFYIIFELGSVLSSLYCIPFTFVSHGFVLRCRSNLPYLNK